MLILRPTRGLLIARDGGVARTVDHAAHAARRNQILDVAQQLVATRGYEQMSIHDVLNELGISKGALYHYFGSKQALLVGIVERMAEEVHTQLARVAEEAGPNAVDTLTRSFQVLAGWKALHREQLVALLRVWNSDGNALLRQKVRAGITERLAPVFEHVIERGVRDGTFTLPTAAGSGRVLLSLIHDLNERLGELFFAYQAGSSDLAAVEQTVTAYTTAVERILGVAAGSVRLVELPVLHAWFDPRWQENEKQVEGSRS